MRAMKILHLLSQRPEATGSGAALQAILLEPERAGHENLLVAGIPKDTTPSLPPLSRTTTRYVTFDGGDIPFPIPGMSDVMPYPSMRFADLTDAQFAAYEAAFTTAVMDAADRFRPDIVHSNHLWLLTSLARRILPDIPVAASCHGTDLRQMRSCPRFRNAVLSGCSHLDGVFALHSGQSAEIRDVYGIPPERVHVVGAGFRDGLFARGDKTCDAIRIVYGGKLSRAKGVPWMLRAFASLDSCDGPPWTLLLAGGGSGQERSECIELAQALGNRVTVAGAMQQGDFAAALATAHLFILPSLYEGLPLVLIEAAASGCVCLATDIPGVREVRRMFGDDWIRLMPCPPLDGPDAIKPGSETRFVRDIAAALKGALRDLTVRPRTPESFDRLSKRLKETTWRAVFRKMERIYRALAQSKGALPEGERLIVARDTA
jgi:glycosyltransferase involved in cell wall biosynthesis